MLRRKDTVAPRIETLLGRSVRVQGDLDFAGGLHLDGCVTGQVRAVSGPEATLSVGEHGRIEGSVEVPNVVLNGFVRGDIYACGRVVLGARARVEGDVHYGNIETAPGAEIRGRLVPCGPASATEDGAGDRGPPG